MAGKQETSEYNCGICSFPFCASDFYLLLKNPKKLEILNTRALPLETDTFEFKIQKETS